MALWAAQGTPVSRKGMRQKVYRLIGKLPSLRWVDKFRKRHPKLVYVRPSPLDTKRAQCFNPGIISKYFKDFKRMVDVFGPFLPMNMYNMDEKGVQMGGGRKSSGVKYFFNRADRSRYRKRSASLELVTIIECVSAAGEALTPGFIFSGSTFDMAWFEDNADREGL